MYILFFISTILVGIHAKTGEEIVELLYKYPNECQETETGSWSGISTQENPDCSPGLKCDYPKQWCWASLGPNFDYDNPNLHCVDLSPACQKAIQGFGDTTTEATSSGGTTPNMEITNSSQASIVTTSGVGAASNGTFIATNGSHSNSSL